MLRKINMLFTSEQTCLGWVMEIMGYSAGTFALFLAHNCKATYYHLLLPPEGNRGLFQASLWVLACADFVLLLLLTHQVRLVFGGNLMHVQTDFQNALNWTKRNLQHVSHFKNGDSSVFKNKFLLLMYITICFSHICSKWSALQQTSHCFWTLNTNQQLVFFPKSAP